jgi:hypothetical protein
MKRPLSFILFFGILFGSIGLVQGFDYLYLTDTEITRFGDRIKLWPVDSLDGYLRTNGSFACVSGTDFHGMAIQHEPLPPESVCAGILYTNSIIAFPNRLETIRDAAASEGQFYSGNAYQYRVILDGTVAHLYRWRDGTPFDSTMQWIVLLPSFGTYLFFDGRLTIHGQFQGELTIGASHDIGIEDNITYVDADNEGRVASTSPNFLRLASEHDIKILNTWANGRENSGGLGLAQTDPALTSVVLDGIYVALNESFTFENQNDPDSGYVCTCQPDDRGTIYLYGGVAQRRRGYVHRSTRNSTGYLKQYRFDARWFTRGDGVFAPLESIYVTDTLDYGPVVINTSVWDTAYVELAYQTSFAGANASYPWYSSGGSPLFGDSFAIPCRFMPPHTGDFSGLLNVFVGGETFQIVLRGEGTLAADDRTSLPREFALAAYPNPFNSSTTLRYSLASGERADLRIIDLAGREVASFNLNSSPGERVFTWDARNLASGLYFARLQSGSHFVTTKLLLLK